MIARHWKGIAKAEEAGNYIRHLMTDTYPKMSAIDGFIKADILQRTTGDGIEFLIMTSWVSMNAVKQFAGENPDLAVVPASVQKMMLSFDDAVAHYEVLGIPGGNGK